MTPLERFDAMMEYQPLDRLPNWELGAWPQARQRWADEGLAAERREGDWFSGLPALGMDPKIFAPIDFHLRPPFAREVLEEDERHEVVRNHKGVVTRALKTGAVGGGRACMDQYLRFPVENLADFEQLRQRFDPHTPGRYPDNWDALVAAWRQRDCPLVLGRNCSAGFYWNAREWMGTEGLSLALYDQPALIEAMMEFLADFVIELTARARRDITFDYFCLNEDLAFKSGPLISPAQYRRFIVPPMTRLIDELKRHGVRYVCLDTDGTPEPLIPLMMEAGVDILWPLERASEGVDPAAMRRRYGRQLRLWGAVDKREIARGPAAIDAHLASLRPMVADGGFVPHLDHTFPPDISRADFEYYLERKEALLVGS
ncbi:MAG: hypothetical protein HUU35_18660 [Armatimonadetes bacterium]|nr:hypothetical protein [Armatimonadota bacterium]